MAIAVAAALFRAAVPEGSALEEGPAYFSGGLSVEAQRRDQAMARSQQISNGGRGIDQRLRFAHVNGSYTVLVSGYYRGEGRAAVGAGSVNITVPVTSDSGKKGQLRASNLRRDGNYFSGVGTLFGHNVTITGRLDPTNGELVKVSRICSHIEVADGHFGLLVGQRRGQ